MENQTPRTHPTFWRSPGGVATAIGLGVAAAAGLVYALAPKTAAAGTTPTTPGTTPPPGVISATPGNYYVFSVTSSMPQAQLQAALTAVGFAQVQVQPDPINTGNYVVSGLWTGTANGVATGFLPTAGWTVNGALGSNGTTAPPTPTSWQGDNGSGVKENLIAGNWYAFSIATSFLSGTPGAQAAIVQMLTNYGGGGALVTAAADTSANPDTWNVIAQWDGASTVATDAPPVWILKPRVSSTPPAVGPIDLGSTVPTTPPPNTMPW